MSFYGNILNRVDKFFSTIKAGNKILTAPEDGQESLNIIGDNGIQIDGNEANKTITIDGKNLFVSIEADNDETDHALKYILKQNGVEVGTLNIPLDSFLESTDIVTKNDKNETGQFLKLVFWTNEGEYSTEYVDMSELLTMPNNIKITGPVGRVTQDQIDEGGGSYEWNCAGKTIPAALDDLLSARIQPIATLPSGTIELTNNGNKNYIVEIGSSVTPSWKTTFSAGSYTYGPATGSTATAATVSLSTNSAKPASIAAGAMNNKTGNLSAFTVADATKHYIKVTYGWTAGTSTPIDNFGDEYTNTANNLPIQAAFNQSDTSTYYIQGYRKAFYGSKTSPVELTSANIRQLANANSTSGSVSVTVVKDAKQVIIAVPANRKVTKVADEAAFGTDIFEKFVPTTVSVGGADATASSVGKYATDYTVYTYTPSAALGANTYTVTLANA